MAAEHSFTKTQLLRKPNMKTQIQHKIFKWIRNKSFKNAFFILLTSMSILVLPVNVGLGCEPPTISVDLGDNNNGGDDSNIEVLQLAGESILLIAVGGSTEQPNCCQGNGPWTKTGNVQYTWYIDGSGLDTSVDDGDSTTEPYMTVDLDTAGSADIQVALQEEYQDSSTPPNIVWSPE